MNKMKKLVRKRLITLIVAIAVTILSFYNAFISFGKFWEIDSIIFTTRNYTDYDSLRAVYFVATGFFFFIGIGLAYAIIMYRGRLYDLIFRKHKRSK